MSSQDSQDRHFSRRLKATIEGLHLPSEEELLRGMSFFRGNLGEDIREYAERLWRRVRKRGDLAFAYCVSNSRSSVSTAGRGTSRHASSISSDAA